MTPRLVVLWLIDGAQTVFVAAGVLFVCMLIWLAVVACAASGEPFSLFREAMMLALSQLAAYCAGAVLLATAAWSFLHSVLAAFFPASGEVAE